MASWEIALVSKILETKSADIPIIRYGITENHFKDITAKRMFQFILKHRNKFGEFPSIELVQTTFPEYSPVTMDDGMEAICDQIAQLNFNMEMRNMIQKITGLFDSDPRAALSAMSRGTKELQDKWKFSPNDIELAKFVKIVQEDYDKVKTTKGITGLPYPWEYLSTETGGMHRQDLIVLYGSPKSCKSWILLLMAVHLYKEEGKKVLVVTKEMSPQQVARRSAALYSKVNYGDFVKGKMESSEEARFKYEMENMANSENFIITDGRGADGGSVSVSTIMSKVDEYHPDIVFVDGVYLLHDDRGNDRTIDYKNITHITQDLKELAQIKNIPVVVTTQTNRSGDASSKYDDIGYSASFTRDADIVLRIFRNIRTKEIGIQIKAIREGEEKGFVINASLANDMSFKSAGIPNLKEFMLADRQGGSPDVQLVTKESIDNDNNKNFSSILKGRFHKNS